MAVQEHQRSPAVEDYCKAIFTLESRAEGAVSTNALAERLQITPGSVSAMLKRLDGEGLIVRVPYRGVRLTPAGRRVALEVIRHHRLLELFLAETLQMPWDRVHAEAEVLEHVLSEELESLIAAKLGDPKRDPHGDPIPSAELELPEDEDTRGLDRLREGEAGVFVRVSDADPEMLRYLSDHGIAPGDRVRVIERQPFGGPLLVSFAGGEREQAIGGQLARAMRIAPEEGSDAEPSFESKGGSSFESKGGSSFESKGGSKGGSSGESKGGSNSGPPDGSSGESSTEARSAIGQQEPAKA